MPVIEILFCLASTYNQPPDGEEDQRTYNVEDNTIGGDGVLNFPTVDNIPDHL